MPYTTAYGTSEMHSDNIECMCSKNRGRILVFVGETLSPVAELKEHSASHKLSNPNVAGSILARDTCACCESFFLRCSQKWWHNCNQHPMFPLSHLLPMRITIAIISNVFHPPSFLPSPINITLPFFRQTLLLLLPNVPLFSLLSLVFFFPPQFPPTHHTSFCNSSFFTFYFLSSSSLSSLCISFLFSLHHLHTYSLVPFSSPPPPFHPCSLLLPF